MGRVDRCAPVSLFPKTKVNDINLNDRLQMQNDTENEIGRSLFPFIYNYNCNSKYMKKNYLKVAVLSNKDSIMNKHQLIGH